MFDSCLSEFGCRRRQGEIQRPVNVEAIAHAFKQPLSVFIASAEADAPDVVLVPENALPVSLPTPVDLILAKIAALPEARILALGVALGVYGLRKPIDPSFAGVRENGQQ